MKSSHCEDKQKDRHLDVLIDEENGLRIIVLPLGAELISLARINEAGEWTGFLYRGQTICQRRLRAGKARCRDGGPFLCIEACRGLTARFEAFEYKEGIQTISSAGEFAHPFWHGSAACLFGLNNCSCRLTDGVHKKTALRDRTTVRLFNLISGRYCRYCRYFCRRRRPWRLWLA